MAGVVRGAGQLGAVVEGGAIDALEDAVRVALGSAASFSLCSACRLSEQELAAAAGLAAAGNGWPGWQRRELAEAGDGWPDRVVSGATPLRAQTQAWG